MIPYQSFPPTRPWFLLRLLLSISLHLFCHHPSRHPSPPDLLIYLMKQYYSVITKISNKFIILLFKKRRFQSFLFRWLRILNSLPRFGSSCWLTDSWCWWLPDDWLPAFSQTNRQAAVGSKLVFLCLDHVDDEDGNEGEDDSDDDEDHDWRWREDEDQSESRWWWYKTSKK